jgi:hypothetical protein
MVALILLSGCQSVSLSGRHDAAQKIAAAGNMTKIAVAAAPFELTGFERLSAKGAPVTLYIEGDGLAWLSKTQPSLNPTPTMPTALELAAIDTSPNVIYLARPCQYSGRLDGQPCASTYWMGSRYAPEVLQAYNHALDGIIKRTSATGFHLVGFSGGATLAALLAGQRDDILSLRSIAGNLDHRAHSEVHKVSYLAHSLNPPEYAKTLAEIPQWHFIGGKDRIVPQEIYNRYRAALPHTRCTQVQVVAQADHNKGWHDFWHKGHSLKPQCTKQERDPK